MHLFELAGFNFERNRFESLSEISVFNHIYKNVKKVVQKHQETSVFPELRDMQVLMFWKLFHLMPEMHCFSENKNFCPHFTAPATPDQYLPLP